MNEILLFVSILCTFACVLLFDRILGEKGLYIWVAIAVILANIEVLKSVSIFSFNSTLGNAAFASTFLCTDILNEKYGYKSSKNAVKVSILAVICFQLLLQIDLLFTPNEFDFASGMLDNLFAFAPRICIGSIVAMGLANYLDVFLYEYIKCKISSHMWLRNNVATIIAQSLENFIFHIIAFAGVYSFEVIVEITFTVTAIEIMIALFDTPFLYLANKSKIRCENVR